MDDSVFIHKGVIWGVLCKVTIGSNSLSYGSPNYYWKDGFMTGTIVSNGVVAGIFLLIFKSDRNGVC